MQRIRNEAKGQSLWPNATSEGEIRILDLLPGTSNDPIESEIRFALLADMPEYEAISYVWGSHRDLKTVKVSGLDVQITTNVFNILRQFRHPDRKRALWIDQLCINQQDNTDKANQVALMGDIYRNCTECQVWLGNVGDLDLSFTEAEDAFAGVREIAHCDECSDAKVPFLFTDDRRGEGARRAFRNLFTYLGNPWWRRVWTVQEIILPSKAIMNCGGLKINLEEIKRASKNLLSGSEIPDSWTLTPHLYTFELSEFVAIVCGFAITQAGETALNILRRWCPREASDSRDMVYGLMGLFPLDAPWKMAANYTWSTAQVYAKTTIELVRQMNDLVPMTGMRGLPRRIESLPTWAEDFTAYRDTGRYPLSWSRFMILSRYYQFNANCQTMPEIEVIDDSAIRMKGFKCDIITATGRFLGEDYWNQVSQDDIRDLANDWRSWLQQIHGPSCDLQASEHAELWEIFLRTLLSDGITDDEFVLRSASASDLEELKSFLGGDGEATRTIIPSLKNNLVYQRIFHTAKGWIGIGPATLVAGDEVWVFYGGRMPFIMRSEPTYEMIGESYVYGIMNGEAFAMGFDEDIITVT